MRRGKEAGGGRVGGGRKFVREVGVKHDGGGGGGGLRREGRRRWSLNRVALRLLPESWGVLRRL